MKIQIIALQQKALSDAIAKQLQSLGHDVTIGSEVTESPGVIDLRPLALQNSIDQQYQGVLTIFASVQKWLQQQLAESNGFWLTIVDNGGHFGLQNANKNAQIIAGISGIIKTIKHEFPNKAPFILDVDRTQVNDEALAKTIIEILTQGCQNVELALPSAGELQALKTTKTQLPPIKATATTPLNLVVTGGVKGVTADCLLALAKIQPFNALILGRTKLVEIPAEIKDIDDEQQLRLKCIELARNQKKTITPAMVNQQLKQYQSVKEIQQSLEKYQKLGCHVIYESASVTDKAALAEAIAKGRDQFSQFHGLVYGAGIILDKKIVEKPLQQFQQVFDTKVIGALNILEILANDPLRHICFFSSISAREGNNGQVDYACANEVLNKIAQVEQVKRNGNCIVKSINWGAWDGGMVSGALRQFFIDNGIVLLDIDFGANMFVQEFFNPDRQVEVVYHGKL